jgi:hypothetical protein
MRLATADGKPVFFHTTDKRFVVIENDEIVDVDEAVITEGNVYTPLPVSFVTKCLVEVGMPEDVPVNISTNQYYARHLPSPKFKAHYIGKRQGWWGNHKEEDREYFGDGRGYGWEDKDWKFYYFGENSKQKEMSKSKIDKIFVQWKVISDYVEYEQWPLCGATYDADVILQLIGLGKTVTPESLICGAPKGEKFPRYWNGDTASYAVKGGRKFGVIKSLTKKGVSIRGEDGKCKTYAYDKVQKEKSVEGVDFQKILSKTVLDNLQAALDETTLYKSKVENRKIDDPYLSGENVHERNCAHCPNCGTIMASGYGWYGDATVYECVMCGQIAHLLKMDGEVGIFIMAPKPARNQFNIEEARCCNNCGRFRFEYGRQGKRCTGYCKASNQTVVAHNTCKGWIPQDSDTYGKTLTQHITNLHFGVQDQRNKKRIEKNLEDLIYREEHHTEQKKRRDRVVGAYTAAYADFQNRLIDKAKDLPVDEVI